MRFPDAQYVAKLDSDTVLFPERYFRFVRMVHTAVGTSQPLYMGTRRGTSGSYMQGHAVTWNRAGLEQVLHGLNASLNTTRLVNEMTRSGQHMEDI